MEEDSHFDVCLSFYGDDFTGSTDVMESLTLNGIPAALFLEPPSPEEVQRFELKNCAFSADRKLRAFGVAGVSRTMDRSRMSQELPAIFQKLSAIPSRFFHYKICSTFDSSPDTGNIGYAVELALARFPSSFIPLLVGAPELNRFCVFGNLFARVDDKTFRLDRHPTMSKHPVTPMSESDIRVHLGLQTRRKINLIDILDLERPIEETLTSISDMLSPGAPEYLLFDVLDNSHLEKIGELLWRAPSERTQLVVGSSAVEHAIASYLQQRNSISKQEVLTFPGEAEKLVVMAGSCSPGTERQIRWAVKIGFEDVRINTVNLADSQLQEEELERIINLANEALLQNRSVMLYTALGPEDSCIDMTKQKLKEFSSSKGNVADHLAKLQGTILRELLIKHPRTRVVVAGGDTSGQAALALDIYALEVLIPIAPGAPLCVAHSKNPVLDGMQIALKGGQNGNERYFESVLRGKVLT
jgi:3-oxoisoapionate kinase